ncbi:MAG: alpha/beta family hydrolase [Candidatus Kariarchaeaceae archaeon]|jgi:predicted alpha/beta-hydrolase family hydrolase
MDTSIPFEPPLTAVENIVEGEWGVILSHDENSYIDRGILPALAKQLKKKRISSILFNSPYRMEMKKLADEITKLDQSFLAVWNYITEKYPNKRWCVGGHGIAAETAIRISGLIFDDTGIPPVLGLSYPMYPPNRPELVDTMTLGALMGEALFCQGTKSKRGTFDRLRNQIQMMATHAHISRIGGANHQLEVESKSLDTVAYWISKDFEKFLKDL